MQGRSLALVGPRRVRSALQQELYDIEVTVQCRDVQQFVSADVLRREVAAPIEEVAHRSDVSRHDRADDRPLELLGNVDVGGNADIIELRPTTRCRLGLRELR